MLAGTAVERDFPQPAAFGTRPAAVVPGARDEIVQMIGIALIEELVNLHGTVEVLLVPPAGNVQIRNFRRSDVGPESLFLPELVVVGMVDEIVPGGKLEMEILFVHVRERSEVHIPLVRVGAIK